MNSALTYSPMRKVFSVLSGYRMRWFATGGDGSFKVSHRLPGRLKKASRLEAKRLLTPSMSDTTGQFPSDKKMSPALERAEIRKGRLKKANQREENDNDLPPEEQSGSVLSLLHKMRATLKKNIRSVQTWTNLANQVMAYKEDMEPENAAEVLAHFCEFASVGGKPEKLLASRALRSSVTALVESLAQHSDLASLVRAVVVLRRFPQTHYAPSFELLARAFIRKVETAAEERRKPSFQTLRTVHIGLAQLIDVDLSLPTPSSLAIDEISLSMVGPAQEVKDPRVLLVLPYTSSRLGLSSDHKLVLSVKRRIANLLLARLPCRPLDLALAADGLSKLGKEHEPLAAKLSLFMLRGLNEQEGPPEESILNLRRSLLSYRVSFEPVWEAWAQASTKRLESLFEHATSASIVTPDRGLSERQLRLIKEEFINLGKPTNVVEKLVDRRRDLLWGEGDQRETGEGAETVCTQKPTMSSSAPRFPSSCSPSSSLGHLGIALPVGDRQDSPLLPSEGELERGGDQEEELEGEGEGEETHGVRFMPFLEPVPAPPPTGSPPGFRLPHGDKHSTRPLLTDYSAEEAHMHDPLLHGSSPGKGSGRGPVEMLYFELWSPLLAHPFLRFVALVLLPVFVFSWVFAASKLSSEWKEVDWALGRTDSLLLTLALSPGAYVLGNMQGRLRLVRSSLFFTFCACLVSAFISIFAADVEGMFAGRLGRGPPEPSLHGHHSSSKKDSRLRLFMALFGGLTSLGVILYKHLLYSMKGGWTRELFMGTFIASVGFLLSCSSSSLLPPHQWVLGFLLTMLCRDSSPFSWACQAGGVGLWMHGAAVWGTK